MCEGDGGWGDKPIRVKYCAKRPRGERKSERLALFILALNSGLYDGFLFYVKDKQI